MPETLDLDPQAEDPVLLAQVVDYYHRVLKAGGDGMAYLKRRGVDNAQAIDHFRLGYSNRTLGYHLPSGDAKAGRVIRDRLQRIGLYRPSGHENLHGSVVFPILAGDQIVDIYGRKIRGDHERYGISFHTHLRNDQRRGVWNLEGFCSGDEIILCPGVFDALTLWSNGYRNATCMFSPDTLTKDILDALREFNIQRVLTSCEAVVDRLLEAGLEVFVLRLPRRLDINDLACKSQDPADALGSLLRHAEWAGRGRRPVPSTPEPSPECPASGEAVEPVEVPSPEPRQESQDLESPQRIASPVPAVAQDIAVEIGQDEVTVNFGSRMYRARGLARNTTMDVLRVNLLVSDGPAMHIDTFDLYSSRHRQMFQKQAAEELRVEETVIKRDLGRFMLKLEEVQDAAIEALTKPRQTHSDMPAEDRVAALELLRSPDLLERVVEGCGVVGERTNKLVAFLAAVSRKLDQPLAILIQSTSAAGKTTLMEAVLSLLPPEDVVKFSAMTGQSLYYLGEDSLKHKVLAIVEEEGAARAGYALKLLQSEGELRIASTGKEVASGRLVTQEYKVEGPVMLFLTTTSISVDEELMNRCLVLTVDEDRQQTRAIHQMQRQRQTLAGQLSARDRQDTLRLHRDAQRLLKPLLVVNPFAESLTFSDTQTRTRRDHAKYLTLIRAITLLHQHQRPIRTTVHRGQPVDYIEATLEDLALANELATQVLGRSLDDLPPQTRRLLDSVDALAREVCEHERLDRSDFRFTRRQLREFTNWGNTQLKVHLRRLVDLEYLVVHRESDSRRHSYELLYHRPVEDHSKMLPGLLDVEHLRRQEWSECGRDRPGQGRPTVGIGSA